MSEINKIKSELLAARKAKNKIRLNVCKLILSDIEYEERKEDQDTFTDEDVIKKLRKFVSNNELTILHSEDKEQIEILKAENEFCKELIGVELTEDELRVIIKEIDPSDIGQGMQFLNKNHKGKFNGGIASKVVKEHLGLIK